MLASSGVTVDLHEEFNSDPNRTPWVGIYRNDAPLTPHRANVTAPWNADVEYSIYCQAADFQQGASGREATDKVERLLAAVLTAVNCDRTLGLTGLHLVGMEVAPFARVRQDGGNIFTDEIVLRYQLYA